MCEDPIRSFIQHTNICGFCSVLGTVLGMVDVSMNKTIYGNLTLVVSSWQLRSGFATRYILELEVCLKKKKTTFRGQNFCSSDFSRKNHGL